MQLKTITTIKSLNLESKTNYNATLHAQCSKMCFLKLTSSQTHTKKKTSTIYKILDILLSNQYAFHKLSTANTFKVTNSNSNQIKVSFFLYTTKAYYLLSSQISFLFLDLKLITFTRCFLIKLDLMSSTFFWYFFAVFGSSAILFAFSCMAAVTTPAFILKKNSEISQIWHFLFRLNRAMSRG